jgi:hypothetical protein
MFALTIANDLFPSCQKNSELKLKKRLAVVDLQHIAVRLPIMKKDAADFSARRVE